MGTQVERSPVAAAFDAPERVTRFGMIALSSDLTSERDATRLIPGDRAALHVARVANTNPTTPENLRLMAPRLTDAAALLPEDIPLAAIFYSCTAASVVIGDAAVAQSIQAARPGVPVVTPISATIDAFAALGVHRIALVTPYLEETTVPMAAHFERCGIGIATAQCLGVADDRDIARISHATIIEAACAADCPQAEALFLSCTALPALGVIDALERRLGKPVVSSNLASFWRLLDHGGIPPRDGAPGCLFRGTPQISAA